MRSLLYRLQARIDVAPIAEDEVRATGWDRSDYAGQTSEVSKTSEV